MISESDYSLWKDFILELLSTSIDLGLSVHDVFVMRRVPPVSKYILTNDPSRLLTFHSEEKLNPFRFEFDSRGWTEEKTVLTFKVNEEYESFVYSSRYGDSGHFDSLVYLKGWSLDQVDDYIRDYVLYLDKYNQAIRFLNSNPSSCDILKLE